MLLHCHIPSWTKYMYIKYWRLLLTLLLLLSIYIFIFFFHLAKRLSCYRTWTLADIVSLLANILQKFFCRLSPFLFRKFMSSNSARPFHAFTLPLLFMHCFHICFAFCSKDKTEKKKKKEIFKKHNWICSARFQFLFIQIVFYCCKNFPHLVTNWTLGLLEMYWWWYRFNGKKGLVHFFNSTQYQLINPFISIDNIFFSVSFISLRNRMLMFAHVMPVNKFESK